MKSSRDRLPRKLSTFNFQLLTFSLLVCLCHLASCGTEQNKNPLLPSPCDRSSASLAPTICEVEEDCLIDDFEDGNDTHDFGDEKWLRVDDTGNQGDSFITNFFEFGVMRVEYQLGPKLDKPFAEVQAKFVNPDFQSPFRDFTRSPFTNITKIEFRMKGSGNEVRVGLGNSSLIPTFNFYWHEIFKSCAEWTFYSITLKSNAPDDFTSDGFAQGTWATNNSFNALIQDVDALIFKASSEKVETGWFIIDDLRLTY